MYKSELCPECGDEFKQLGNHWRWSPEHRPSITNRQGDIITGLLMGDGYIHNSTKNPYIETKMVSKSYLEYIDNIFGCLGTGVSLKRTADESAKMNRESGFSPNANSNDYSDMYLWSCRSHPDLQTWANWYSTGEKVFPDNIELTPTVLKHWYCGDGHWDNSRSNHRIEISMSNEVGNLEKIDQIFENVQLPSPSNYNIGEQRKSDGKMCTAQWTVKQSRELWEYMGSPLPDFEYKWPEEYR